MTLEQLAGQEIDRLLTAAGWAVQDFKHAHIHAARGVAIREFQLNPGFGEADYLLYVDGKAAGIIEAKKQGATLTGVEVQSGKYAQGLPATLPAWRRPLSFVYESTGAETHFTNALDPEPCARGVFAFHRPETLAAWLGAGAGPGVVPAQAGTQRLSQTAANESPAPYELGTFLARVRNMPPLIDKLWPPKPQAIANIEKSLAANRPRALVQMATGSGKTLLAIVLAYRLMKFAGARRVLFLVDRGNLGRQTKKEFDQYVSPYNNFKFGEEYIVQHLTSNQIDTTARVCITTIQRMFSMLKGRELPEGLEETSLAFSLPIQGGEAGVSQSAALRPLSGERMQARDFAAGGDGSLNFVEPIDYNPAIPIETFDIIVTDEAHRSIYNLWRQVLEYFDASLIGLTATPSKQTLARSSGRTFCGRRASSPEAG